MSANDVTELVAPSKDVSSKVAKFLKNAGAKKVEDHRDMIKVTAKVSVIEKLLETKLYEFRHNKSMFITHLFNFGAILVPFFFPPPSFLFLISC